MKNAASRMNKRSSWIKLVIALGASVSIFGTSLLGGTAGIAAGQATLPSIHTLSGGTTFVGGAALIKEGKNTKILFPGAKFYAIVPTTVKPTSSQTSLPGLGTGYDWFWNCKGVCSHGYGISYLSFPLGDQSIIEAAFRTVYGQSNKGATNVAGFHFVRQLKPPLHECNYWAAGPQTAIVFTTFGIQATVDKTAQKFVKSLHKA